KKLRWRRTETLMCSSISRCLPQKRLRPPEDKRRSAAHLSDSIKSMFGKILSINSAAAVPLSMAHVYERNHQGQPDYGLDLDPAGICQRRAARAEVSPTRMARRIYQS